MEGGRLRLLKVLWVSLAIIEFCVVVWSTVLAQAVVSEVGWGPALMVMAKVALFLLLPLHLGLLWTGRRIRKRDPNGRRFWRSRPGDGRNP